MLFRSNGLKINYRYRETLYEIVVQHPASSGGALTISLDGEEQHGNVIALTNDGAKHAVRVTLASK